MKAYKSLNVIKRVLPATLACTLFAALVTCVHILTFVKLNIGISLITSISMVISLLLVFRTNTAYDRYWEGRRLWSTVHLCIRNFARTLWVNVKEPTPEDVVAKKTVMNLLLAFAVATKHYLREEFGTFYDDLHPLLRHIPQYATPAALTSSGSSPAPSESWIESSCLSSLSNYYRAKLSNRAYPVNSEVAANLPYEISLYISGYVQQIRNTDHADVPSTNIMHNSLNQLTDCLTGFERIRRTPIPLAYSLHLSISVYLYILALPFQLVGILNWVTIPITFMAAFILLGIESIGAEIENPFGYDSNDLPLDMYCEIIKQELDAISSRPAPTNVRNWGLSSKNKPVESSNATAAELSRLSMEDVREILKENRPQKLPIAHEVVESGFNSNTSTPVLEEVQVLQPKNAEEDDGNQIK
ncbi:uncharacterized protein VTP21DRAFT_4939 [Calcarisporiella thermophila]|uniref:uncharacterized protein n=1 Tax=Calcarisporiella thermophila TaxID=911321 RepID=UPI0037440C6B